MLCLEPLLILWVSPTLPNYEISQRIKHAEDVKLNVPGFTAELKPFQSKGVAWMYAVERGILADDVGLGKTVTSIALAALIKSQGKLGNVLIACPGGHERHWNKLLREMAPGVFEDIVIVSGIHKGRRRTRKERIDVYTFSPRIMIMNYSILRNDAAFLRQFKFGMIVLDEASAFKNHETKLFEAVSSLTVDAARVYALTATPFQKALLELHSVLRAMHIDVLGTIEDFRRNYEVIEWLEIRNRKAMQQYKRQGKDPRDAPKMYVPKSIGYQNLDEFKAKIDPVYLRREEKEVEDQLPEVRPVQTWLEPDGKFKTFYDGLVREFKNGGGLGSFTRLVQACDAPYVTTLSEDKTSPKAKELVRLLQEDFIDEKVVVFARWHRSIDVIREHLDAADISYVVYTGLQDEFERDQIKTQFIEDPSIQCFIMTTAGEMGIDGLQVAKALIAFNQLYNPQRMKQVVGRIRRLGSEHKSVLFINLMIEGSIEEKMWELLMARADLFDSIFNTDSTTTLFDDPKALQTIQAQALRELQEGLADV